MTQPRGPRRDNALSLCRTLQLGLVLAAAACALGVEGAWNPFGAAGQRQSALAARRAADDSRPLARVAAGAQDSPVVLGKFRAPAPERVLRQRLPKASQFVSQTMSASYQVADSSAPDKLVHGVLGASAGARTGQRTVGAKMLVSDEGLNYPPSKLSADIYGNVAEIVTAPPEAVDSDFLLPNSRRFSAQRP